MIQGWFPKVTPPPILITPTPCQILQCFSFNCQVPLTGGSFLIAVFDFLYFIWLLNNFLRPKVAAPQRSLNTKVTWRALHGNLTTHLPETMTLKTHSAMLPDVSIAMYLIWCSPSENMSPEFRPDWVTLGCSKELSVTFKASHVTTVDVEFLSANFKMFEGQPGLKIGAVMSVQHGKIIEQYLRNNYMFLLRTL